MPPKIKYFVNASMQEMYDVLKTSGKEVNNDITKLKKDKLIQKVQKLTNAKSFNPENYKVYTPEEESLIQSTQGQTTDAPTTQGQTTQGEPQDDLKNEEKELAAELIQKIGRGRKSRKNLQDAKEVAAETVDKLLDKVSNISKYKKRKEKKEEAQKVLDQVKQIMEPIDKAKNLEKRVKDELLNKKYRNWFVKVAEKMEERIKKDEQKKQKAIEEDKESKLQKQKEATERRMEKRLKKEEEDYYREAESFYKNPENLRGEPPKPPRSNIVPFDPKNIIPEKDHKQELQFKKIKRKEVGEIDNGVKTEKKKLNTHVDATVKASDIRAQLEKQKKRLKLKPANIIYHRLGKSVAKAAADLL